MCRVRISSHCASRLQHVVIVTNCARQAVVNLCVVCSLQTVLSILWNGLPSNTDFSSLTSFEHTIEMIDFSQLLRYE